MFVPAVVCLRGLGSLEVFWIGGGGGGAFGVGVTGFLSVKVEAFFIDGEGVMAFSGFFSSETEDIDTLSPWSSLYLNEPRHDGDKV